MPKKMSVIVGSIILLIAAGVTYVVLMGPVRMPDQPGQADSQSSTPQMPANEASPAPTPLPGTYADYRPDSVTATAGTKILFFHAPWCPQCRQLDADIKLHGVPSGVTIFKVDYDTSQNLRQKYGVTIQTTLIMVDDQGNLIKKFVAYDDPTIAAVRQHLLQ